MELEAAGLKEQPFPTHGRPLTVASYLSQREGLAALRKSLVQPGGIVLLQGPGLSGKSTLLRTFIDSLDKEQAVALVDGKGLSAMGLLEAVLLQFGYEIEVDAASELAALLRVYAQHQAANNVPPLLVIENTHALKPSALRTLCELASLEARRSNGDTFSALHMALFSDRSLAPIVNAKAAKPIVDRVVEDFHLRPMNAEETQNYIHAKLLAAGSEKPEFIFSLSACRALWEASGGWPGIVDRVALLALAKSDTLPLPVEYIEPAALPRGTWESVKEAVPRVPCLFLTYQGDTLRTINFDQTRMLIGRTEHNDIHIESRFISRHHAMLVRYGKSTVIMDLNSTNGTFVNSIRISNRVLQNDDVISVGNHRIKFVDPEAKDKQELGGNQFNETAILKSLEDMRNLLARENTKLLPSLSEEMPTFSYD